MAVSATRVRDSPPDVVGLVADGVTLVENDTLEQTEELVWERRVDTVVVNTTVIEKLSSLPFGRLCAICCVSTLLT